MTVKNWKKEPGFNPELTVFNIFMVLSSVMFYLVSRDVTGVFGDWLPFFASVVRQSYVWQLCFFYPILVKIVLQVSSGSSVNISAIRGSRVLVVDSTLPDRTSKSTIFVSSQNFSFVLLPFRVVSRARLFGSGSGLKLAKILGLNRAWDVLFVLGAQK